MKQIQSQQKEKETRSGVFGPFPRGPKGLVEKSPLIKHSPRKQEELQRIQNVERSANDAENQSFLRDIVNQVQEGEGVGWLKLNRLKKLMEDESYRNFVLSKLNKTLDRKIAPDDHIDDVVSIHFCQENLAVTTISDIAVHSQADLEGYFEGAPGGGAWAGAHLQQFWVRWDGISVSAARNRSYSLLEQRAD